MSRLMRTVAVLVFAALLFPASVPAQGIISGCVTDYSGGVLPGVDVVAASPIAQQRVVTGTSGCYQFTSLPAGTYSLTASLAGFVTGKRDGIAVVDGKTTGPVDLQLCLGGMVEIDWATPGGLDQMWKQADVVAYVRVTQTGRVRSECPGADFEHTAAVIEDLKRVPQRLLGPTVTFVQPDWVGERTPHQVGQKMIVFLVATRKGLERLAGPFSVFLIDGNAVVSRHSDVKTDGISVTEFLATVRALEKR
jgi:hypothetical protein